MTHFNHEWTSDTTPIPQAVGDRFYAQDLNDDFNYLKHLPYEAILQSRNAGVMIPPSDTWNVNTHTLSLSGGFGVVHVNTQVLDVDEEFVLPPKSIATSRIERVGFQNVTLTLPNDGSLHYIVATPTKRSLLQRTKALLSEQYASRIKYDGVITIQDSFPTSNQILVGVCHDDEYLLCKDFVLDQGKNTIKLHKWFGQNKITQNFVSVLRSYYDTSITSIETKISIDTVSGVGIGGGAFNNCTISINTVSSDGVGIDGTFNNCTISIDTVSGGNGIYGTFNNCTISINTVSSGSGIYGAFDNCTISINTVSGDNGVGGGAFNNCTISINTVSGNGRGIGGGTFNNCTISIDTVSGGNGVGGGAFNNCTISISAVSSGGVGIGNTSSVILYLTHIKCAVITNLSSTSGKLNVLNDTVLHAS